MKMKIKIKKIIYIIFLTFILNLNLALTKEIDLSEKFIPLKDFILLKFDLFLNSNLNNLTSGAGITHVAYQSIEYDVSIDNENKINIKINALMDKTRYKSKKYHPKISDCNQVRNKIFLNKSGYSFFKQSRNNYVSEEKLSLVVNDKILNISLLNKKLKNKILENTMINVNVIHPKSEKNITCSGKLISAELQ